MELINNSALRTFLILLCFLVLTVGMWLYLEMMSKDLHEINENTRTLADIRDDIRLLVELQRDAMQREQAEEESPQQEQNIFLFPRDYREGEA